MANMFKFTLVQSGKAAYDNLVSTSAVDMNTMYAIPSTKEIYFGEDLVASQNVEISTAMPTSGQAGMIYVVTEGNDKGMYVYNETDAKFESVVANSDFLTADRAATLTNKTIDAKDNTISNIAVSNLDPAAVQTTVRDAANATDDAVATEKAIRTELDKKVDKEEGKSLVLDTEIAKLATIAEGANKYEHPDSGVTAGTYNKVTVDAQGHVTAATAETTLAGLGVADAYTKDEVDSAISSVVSGLNWKDAVATFDDIATTYTNPQEGDTVSVKDTNDVYRYDDATGTWINLFQAVSNEVEASDTANGVVGHSGLMTAAMAEKLAGVAEGAEVNQNAYSKVKVGGVELLAADKTDSIEVKAGQDISVTAETDADGNKSVTIASTYVHPTASHGLTTGQFNVITSVDDEGHVGDGLAVETLKEFGQAAGLTTVTADADDIVSMAGYTALTAAPAEAKILATDSLNDAVAKLEYRADNMATELQTVLDGKVDKTQITQVIDANSTEDQVPSAKAVYEALAVVRI